jgi:maleylpyruvate isomerase
VTYDPGVIEHDIERAIAGSREATGRLFDTLEQIDDSVAIRPSLLPGWSVAHVLTHIARNADSFVRVLTGAAEGREVRQYPSANARSQDIDEGATRSAPEIIDDLRASAVRLDATLSEVPDEVWGRQGLRGDGSPLPCRLLPIARWREVEVHHCDLGLGYGVSDWPTEFVSLDLPLALDRVPARIENPAQRAAFLAWIYGRAEEPGGVVLRPF